MIRKIFMKPFFKKYSIHVDTSSALTTQCNLILQLPLDIASFNF